MDQTTYIMHYGILGQRRGKRRYQNEDGTFTELGKKRRREEYESENGGYKRKKSGLIKQYAQTLSSKYTVTNAGQAFVKAAARTYANKNGKRRLRDTLKEIKNNFYTINANERVVADTADVVSKIYSESKLSGEKKSLNDLKNRIIDVELTTRKVNSAKDAAVKAIATNLKNLSNGEKVTISTLKNAFHNINDKERIIIDPVDALGVAISKRAIEKAEGKTVDKNAVDDILDKAVETIATRQKVTDTSTAALKSLAKSYVQVDNDIENNAIGDTNYGNMLIKNTLSTFGNDISSTSASNLAIATVAKTLDNMYEKHDVSESKNTVRNMLNKVQTGKTVYTLGDAAIVTAAKVVTDFLDDRDYKKEHKQKIKQAKKQQKQEQKNVQKSFKNSKAQLKYYFANNNNMTKAQKEYFINMINNISNPEQLSVFLAILNSR